MRVPRVYIETSVFNFFFADDDSEKQQDTKQFFEEIREGKYEPFTSAFVVEELIKAPEPKQSMMAELIKEYNITVLPGSKDMEDLADSYISNGIIPQKYRMDGIHIAATTVSNLDVIVSYNFKHIVKMKTIRKTAEINFIAGYKRIGIYSPTEVIEYVEHDE